MATMTRTAALKLTSTWFAISGRATRWSVACPWSYVNLSGPRTTIDCGSYADARSIATRQRAVAVLILMGTPAFDAEVAVRYDGGSAAQQIAEALRRLAPIGDADAIGR